jgi:cytoskeletal protein CcmA (bactofilin family)
MATLTGNKIKDTYYKLVQVDNGQLVQNGIGSPITGSINLSGSLHVTGSQTVGGDLTVTGDVKARAFITELTQSTVLYKSGSTAFGDDATDTHSFSGSVTMHNSLALGNYANVSASLDAAEDTIIANSASSAVALTSLSASTDSHLDSEISLLSASVDTHLDANITALSGSSHTRREEISSSFATTQASQDSTIQTLASTGSNTFTGDQAYSSSLNISGSLNANGNIIGINDDARVVSIPNRVQFRIIPTASGHLRGNLSITYDPANDRTVTALYSKDIQIGYLVENGLYAENIKLGTTSSLFQITGSTAMSGSLKLGDFADVSASLDAANDSIVANSSSAHTQRTALSASSATVIQTSASIASDYISIEKLKTYITGSYAEFQTAIGSL